MWFKTWLPNTLGNMFGWDFWVRKYIFYPFDVVCTNVLLFHEHNISLSIFFILFVTLFHFPWTSKFQWPFRFFFILRHFKINKEKKRNKERMSVAEVGVDATVLRCHLQMGAKHIITILKRKLFGWRGGRGVCIICISCTSTKNYKKML